MKSVVAFALALVCFTPSAHADFGDLALGGKFGAGYTETQSSSSYELESWYFGSSEFAFRVGLLNWLHLDVDVGTLISADHFNPHFSLGFTSAIDVWTVVPEFSLGGFILMGDGGQGFGAGLYGELALRYHIDLNWSVAVGAELNLGMPSWYQGTASFLYALN